MVRLRQSVLERQSNGPSSSLSAQDAQRLPAPPSLNASPSLHLPQLRPNWQRFEDLLKRARHKIEVSSFIPRVFHGLFRRQGGFNRVTLEVISLLLKENRQIHKQFSDIAAYLHAENDWLSDLVRTHAADRRWQTSSLAELKKASRILVSTFEDLQAQLATTTQSHESFQRSLTETLSESAQVLDDRLKAEIAARERMEAQVSAQQASLDAFARTADWIRDAFAAEAKAREELEEALGNTKEEARRIRAILDVDLALTQAQAKNLERASRIIEERQIADSSFMKGELHLLARNLASFAEAMAKPRRGRAAKLTPAESALDPHALDAFYLAFENQFRGSREIIKDRVRIYLPDIVKAKVGEAKSPILDLGCGRGEWLELLREEGLSAEGVDTNIFMKTECLQRGLHVTEQDALAYLQSKEAASFGAITGFHIIEHLGFPVLLELVSEAFRVLRPGGLVIFETPNPENVLVGTNRFYFDPTHVRPLPKEFASFVLSAAGFTDVEIRTLHPDTNNLNASVEAPQLQQFLNQMFFGDQDYAVIARK